MPDVFWMLSAGLGWMLGAGCARLQTQHQKVVDSQTNATVVENTKVDVQPRVGPERC